MSAAAVSNEGNRHALPIRLVYLDGCETGLANPNGNDGISIAGENDMYDYFGLDVSPIEDEGLYFGWQTTVLLPQSDPYLFFYWNDRYFRRVASGEAFGPSYSDTKQFSPVDNFVKQNTFEEGGSSATMHP